MGAGFLLPGIYKIMQDLSFREWLFRQDWLLVVEAMRSIDAFEAAKVTNNRLLTQLLGMKRNWFGLIIQSAKKWVRGQDIVTVASSVASHLIRSLQNPGNRLAQEVANIHQEADEASRENRLIDLFTTAVELRTRRFSEEFRRKFDANVVPMSSLEKRDQESAEFSNPSSQDGGELESLKRYVIEELSKMEAEAKNKQSRERLQLAQQVAVERMRNAPEMTGMNELMTMFPNIAKTRMYQIIGDIQQALARVAERFGLEGLQAGIKRRQQRNVG